jgi:predicted nucleic acid-binding protein
MRLLDTSAWIEIFLESPLGLKFKKEFPGREHCVVPTIVQLELAKWAERELSDDAADHITAFTQKCLVVPLDTALALSAAELCNSRKLATADAIIYATALAANAELVTCDGHFEALPHVLYFAKDKPASL